MIMSKCIYLSRSENMLRTIGTVIGNYILYDIFELKKNFFYSHIEIWIEKSNKNIFKNYNEIEESVKDITLTFKEENDDEQCSS